MRDDFAVFILTHGRANNQKTYETLRQCGYTGRIFLLIDNVDSQEREYKRRFGDSVIVFDKEAYWEGIDTMNNRKTMNVVVYARNAVFDVAKQHGVKYFAALDDDIVSLLYKMPTKDKLHTFKARNLDVAFEDLASIMDASEKIRALSVAADGSFWGGPDSPYVKSGIRDTACTFFIHMTERRVRYIGTMFEDMVTHLNERLRGGAMFSITRMAYAGLPIGTTEGGCEEAYRASTDWINNFYCVMVRPDCMKVRGRKKGRFDTIKAAHAVGPFIIGEKWRKARSPHEE